MLAAPQHYSRQHDLQLKKEIETLNLKVDNLTQYSQTLIMQNKQLQDAKQTLTQKLKTLLMDKQNLTVLLTQQAQLLTQLQQQSLLDHQNIHQLKHSLQALQNTQPPRITLSEILTRLSTSAFSTQDFRTANSAFSFNDFIQQILYMPEFQPFLIIFIALIVFLFLVSIAFLWHHHRKKTMGCEDVASPSVETIISEEPADPDSKPEPEVEFQGSMASNLDLGRAYIDMGNYDEAKKILSNVLVSGDERQQSEARTLLNKIPQAEK